HEPAHLLDRNDRPEQPDLRRPLGGLLGRGGRGGIGRLLHLVRADLVARSATEQGKQPDRRGGRDGPTRRRTGEGLRHYGVLGTEAWAGIGCGVGSTCYCWDADRCVKRAYPPVQRTPGWKRRRRPLPRPLPEAGRGG